ncbi:MAG: CvpA family protein [Rikenellaceae bacterium]|jgi:membrane protein required for colicin V production|nr:CvpA family protein [Rikenellaceae bacterium]
MNWLDIVIAALLIYAVWDGARQGVVRQVLGLAALVLGIYLAWINGRSVGEILGLEGVAATLTGFAVVLVVVIVAVALIGRLTRGLFRLAGLGVFDNILGIVFSALKMLLGVGLVIMVVESVDKNDKILTDKVKSRSIMYRAATAVTDFVFPYIDLARQSIWDKTTENDK